MHVLSVPASVGTGGAARPSLPEDENLLNKPQTCVVLQIRSSVVSVLGNYHRWSSRQ